MSKRAKNTNGVSENAEVFQQGDLDNFKMFLNKSFHVLVLQEIRGLSGQLTELTSAVGNINAKIETMAQKTTNEIDEMKQKMTNIELEMKKIDSKTE